mgnify:CR=1 FL=1
METFNEKALRLLFENQDETYRNFNSKLIPGTDPNFVIGVRVPKIREIAKELFREGGYEKFFASLPHKYHEENLLHAMMIELFKDFEKAVEETERFLPYITNWAVCDCFSPKCFKKHKKELLEKILVWLKAKDTYTVRFAMKMLMTYFLDDDFNEEYLELVYSVQSEEYYLKMMQAWFFATALAKQYESTVQILENHILSDWVHNKTIQKAIESYRVTNEHKVYLKTLKQK